jgi:hypothetical protein
LADQPEEKKGPKKGPPKGWEPGRVIPPVVRDSLDLTEDQQKKIDELEKEVRAKLMKILSEDQVQRAREMKGPKGPKGDDGPFDKKGKKGKDKDGPSKDGPQVKAGEPNGIQWFGTWEGGKRAASASGKPILLVSAAPHCAGVSGTW